jgi:hypothetical protein
VQGRCAGGYMLLSRTAPFAEWERHDVGGLVVGVQEGMTDGMEKSSIQKHSRKEERWAQVHTLEFSLLLLWTSYYRCPQLKYEGDASKAWGRSKGDP